MLLWDGELRAEFAHRRLCEKPASGGVSVYRESIAMDDDLRERSRNLLNRFGWFGPAMVEYKRDSATGRAYLMEVNGRFWGSLQLAIDSGVDFPQLLVRCALGQPSERIHSYRVGVRSRWWWGQVDHLVGRVGSRAPLPPATVSAPAAVLVPLPLVFRFPYPSALIVWEPEALYSTVRFVSVLVENAYWLEKSGVAAVRVHFGTKQFAGSAENDGLPTASHCHDARIRWTRRGRDDGFSAFRRAAPTRTRDCTCRSKTWYRLAGRSLSRRRFPD